MLDFNVTLEVVKGKYSHTEEYDLTIYSDAEILEYMQNGINENIEEDGGEPITLFMEDLKIVDIDFPVCLYTDDMTLSELIEIASEYADCRDNDEIDMLSEYRDEIDDKADINYVRDCYIGQYRNFKDFSEEMFRDTHDIPEDLEQYIDWDYVAREYEHDYDITKSGYVFSR